MKTFIYELSLNNIPYYIGKTTIPLAERLRNHIYTGKDPNTVLTVIDEIKGERCNWEPLESYWIIQYKQWGFTLENKNNGGGGPKTLLTDEQREEYRKQWYQDNKEHLKKHRLNNKERIKEYKKQYNLNNKEKRKQYLLDNKEWISEQKKQYRLNNKERIKEYDKQYYLNKKLNK